MRKLTSLFVVALAAACSSTPPSEPPRGKSNKPSPTTQPDAPEKVPPFAKANGDVLAKAVAGQNKLGAALYEELRATVDDNFAMSPTSIAVAFGMTYAGARGETERQMETVLRLQLPQTSIHAAYGTLLRSWNSEDERPYDLAVANKLFGQKGFPFRDDFVALTADHYQAPLEGVDFKGAPEEARQTINKWVEERTQDYIKDLLPEDSIKPITRLVLTNAVYFKGKWQSAFPEDATRDAPFFAPTKKLQVPTMHQTGQHRYAEIDGAKMLEMRYEGDDLAMQIILPNDVDGLGALERKLAGGVIDALAAKLESAEVSIALPRFTIASPTISLKKTLKAMGMTDAFDKTRADLSGMADLPPGLRLFIQDAYHKAFVEVQEKGTVAAASTAVVVGIEATTDANTPREFRADHPFLFVIRDAKSGAMLFLGRVMAPSA